MRNRLTTKDTKNKNTFVIFVSFVVNPLIMVLCCLFLVRGSSGILNSSAWLAKVDPRVLEDTADGQTGAFLVVLSARADLTGLALDADGSFHVADGVSRLQRVASANQSGVVAALDRLSRDPANAVAYHAFWLVDSLAVSGKRAVVAALASLPQVARIEPDRGFRAVADTPITPGVQAASSASGIESNLTQVGAPAVWAMGDTGQGIVYANADTGVQWDHPALINQYRGWNADTQTADHNYNWHDAIHENDSNTVAGNPCGFDSKVPCDDQGHGTHTMGIGIGDDGSGNQIGVAPGARWISCRNMEQGWGKPSTYVECLEFLMAPTDLNGQNRRPDLHADVISNSYSCPVSEGCADITVLHQAVKVVRDAGIFMSVSVGNECKNSTANVQIAPPAAEPDVFTVGAVNRRNQIASFSSRGPFTYNGILYQKPDLVAPGLITTDQGIRSSVPGDTYSEMQGTSMAAPHVAGAVALLWSAYPNLRGKVAETENILKLTANHLPGNPSDKCSPGGPSGSPNDQYGYGLLDVQAAYAYLMPYHISLPLVTSQ
jgi:subtilisin family serine protease